jgi:diaminopimelate epimerase
MYLKFTKMHGLGNDFIVIDAISRVVELSDHTIKKLSDRHFGIGFDQLLVVENSDRPEMDFKYRIFNADGGEVGQCGNGARCFARFVREKKLTNKDIISVETLGGDLVLSIIGENEVEVNMGKPIFLPKGIPFIAETQSNNYDLHINGIDEPVSAGVVSMGNPHVVITVEQVENAKVEKLGKILTVHERFPQQTNVGFMQVLGRDRISLRVYERGAAETLACGSGACAAVAVGIVQGKLDQKVVVTLAGGELTINWAGGENPVFMQGTATTVFEGEIEI